jgi:hypothetical protein
MVLRRVQEQFGAHAGMKLSTQDTCTMALKKQIVENEPSEEYEYELIPLIGLTYEEGFAVLDGQARRRLNMSGEEFLRRWKADDFSDEFKDEHHSAFAALCILVRPFANDAS